MKHLKYTFVFILVWAIFLMGCSSWRTQQEFPVVNDPKDVRVRLTDSRTVWLKNAYVRADTLFGSAYAKFGNPSLELGEMAISMSSILEIKERHTNVPNTILLAATFSLILVVAVLGFLVAGRIDTISIGR